MNCPKCNIEVREGALFCSACGERVSVVRETLVESVPTAEAGSGGGAGKPSGGTSDAYAGRVLDGKYELVERLGMGGMGSVYRARRVHIGDEVAVKILHSAYLADESAVERFRREARAAAQLHHPNIVTIHDYGETNAGGEPLAYIVMELVGGASLRDVLKNAGRLAPARAVSLMRQICAGVSAAHRRGIVHRDIKPDNIIVVAPEDEGGSEDVKVVDFGIAKLRDAANESTLTMAGAVIGTPYYMSPEQCLGEKLDARADVYSLGALLYEMIAGTPPFTAPTATGVIAKHLSEPPPPVPADVPAGPSLSTAINRALSKDPNARQSDAAEFARGLLLSDAPTIAALPSDIAMVRQPAQVTPLAPHTGHTPPPFSTTPPSGTSTAQHQQPRPQQHPSQQHQTQQPHPRPQQMYASTPQPVRRKSRVGLFFGLLALFFVVVAGGGIGLYLLLEGSGGGRGQANSATNRGNVSINTNTSNTANANANALTAAAFQRAEAKILNDSRLNAADIAGLSPDELALLRNVVFARHGRTFNSPVVNAYLKTRSWYKVRADYSDEMLTDADEANVNLIRGAEGANAPPDPKAARRDIEKALEGWVESTEDFDLDAHMNLYADTLETYYTQRGVSRDAVRSDRGRAFERFYSMEVELSNVRVILDEAGAGASVFLDKEWKFEGDRCSQGKVQQQLRFIRNGGRWLIAGEKDLKVYRNESSDCE